MRLHLIDAERTVRPQPISGKPAWSGILLMSGPAGGVPPRGGAGRHWLSDGHVTAWAVAARKRSSAATSASAPTKPVATN
jgi:hypothetical protein